MTNKFYGIISGNERNDVNTKGFVQLIKYKEVSKYIEEKMKLMEPEEFEGKEHDMKELKLLLRDKEQNELTTYWHKFPHMFGDSETVVEVYPSEGSKNKYTYSYDSKRYELEVFKNSYFVKLPSISRGDVEIVCKFLMIHPSEEMIEYCLDNYESERENDPTANFRTIIEKMIDDYKSEKRGDLI